MYILPLVIVILFIVLSVSFTYLNRRTGVFETPVMKVISLALSLIGLAVGVWLLLTGR